MENEAKKRFLINLLFSFSVIFLIFLASKMLLSYLLPFVIAIIIAAIVQKPAIYLSKKTSFKTGTIALFLALLLFLVFLSLTVFIIYRVSILLGSFFKDLPDFLNIFTSLISKFENKISLRFEKISPEFSENISEIISGMLENLTQRATTAFSNFATTIAKKTPSFLFSSLITLAASCFIAKDFGSLSRFISLLCGDKIYGNFLKIKEIFNTNVIKILKGYLWLFVITFIELTAGFLILKIKYAPLIAFFVAIVDLLPVLGTGAVLIPWAIIELIFGKTSMAIAIFTIYVIVMIVRNIAEPKIIGGQIGIHPLFMLLSMFVGIKLLGFAGIFIFPITLIVIIKYYKNELENGI